MLTLRVFICQFSSMFACFGVLLSLRNWPCAFAPGKSKRERRAHANLPDHYSHRCERQRLHRIPAPRWPHGVFAVHFSNVKKNLATWAIIAQSLRSFWLNTVCSHAWSCLFLLQVSVKIPDGLKPGDHLHVKVPYPEKQTGVIASPPPDNLHRIIADNTKFFIGSETGHLMYPAFDVANNLVSWSHNLVSWS